MIAHPAALERRVLAGPGEEVSNPAARPEGGDVVGGSVGVFALHAVAGDRCVDQSGMASGQALGIEAETLEAAEANVGDEDVSVRNQVVGDFFALRGGEVEDDAPLGPVVHLEDGVGRHHLAGQRVLERARRIAGGRLDLYDLGSPIGEDSTCSRACDPHAEFDDLHAFEWSCHVCLPGDRTGS